MKNILISDIGVSLPDNITTNNLVAICSLGLNSWVRSGLIPLSQFSKTSFNHIQLAINNIYGDFTSKDMYNANYHVSYALIYME